MKKRFIHLLLTMVALVSALSSKAITYFTLNIDGNFLAYNCKLVGAFSCNYITVELYTTATQENQGPDTVVDIVNLISRYDPQ